MHVWKCPNKKGVFWGVSLAQELNMSGLFQRTAVKIPCTMILQFVYCTDNDVSHLLLTLISLLCALLQSQSE